MEISIKRGAGMISEEKINEYLSDMIAYLGREESSSFEPEDQKKYRYTRFTLESLQKQIDEGAFS